MHTARTLLLVLTAVIAPAACDPATEVDAPFCVERDHLEFSGALQTPRGSIGFDSVEALVHHNDQGPDAGCVTGVYLHFKKSDDHRCSLWVEAENFLDGAGDLAITGATLDGSGHCPGFPSAVSTALVGEALSGSIALDGSVALGDAGGCYEGGLEVRLAGTLVAARPGDEARVTLEPSLLRVEGPIRTVGEPSSCPLPPTQHKGFADLNTEGRP
ncbi:MAG: hypothetical protein R3A51_02790 [Nannocystaceae bacterium]